MHDTSNQTKILLIASQTFIEDCLLSFALYSKKAKIVHTMPSFEEIEKKIAKYKPHVILIGLELIDYQEIDSLSHCLTFINIPILLTSNPTKQLYNLLVHHTFLFVARNEFTTREVFCKSIIIQAQAMQHANKQPIIAKQPNCIIAIGASTGGTDAVETIVKNLPPTTPGIVVVQHMPAVFTNLYAQRLNKNCKMCVKEAVDGDLILNGQILIAAGDKQLEVKYNGQNYYVHCYSGEKISGHCPSVDVLFHSVANVATKHAIGVILTGMGKDGAQGLLHMRQKGAFTIGQDKQSSIVYGMPLAAFQIGAVATQMPLYYIEQAILAHLKKMEVILHE